MGGIFISYRREDSADICGRIFDHLVAHYGKEAVFKDVDNIPYGTSFPLYIQQWLAQSSVCLAVIGPRWLTCVTPDGRRRLDDPNDFVRIEIETAIQRGMVVIPVLVSGAQMPPQEALPSSLANLHHLNAAQVRLDPDFTADMQRLSAGVDRFVPPLAQPAANARKRDPGQVRKLRRRIIRVVSAGALLSLLAGVGVIRYNSPADTLRQFIQNDFLAVSAEAAYLAEYPLVCPDIQPRYSESAAVSNWNANEGQDSDVDLSRVTFTVEDETLSEAHVRVGGILYYTFQGNSKTLTINHSSTNVHLLRATGLGWCVTADLIPTSDLSG